MSSNNSSNNLNIFPENEDEVYLFGWMINTHPETAISVSMADLHILSCIKKIFPEADIFQGGDGFVANIERTRTRGNINDKIPEQFKWDFIRGVFDKVGEINLSRNGVHTCSIRCLTEEIKEYILSNCDVSNFLEGDKIIFSSVNVVDFLSKIYDCSTQSLRNRGKYQQYVDIINWSSMNKNDIPLCKFSRTKVNAVIPSKNRATDEGYDLTIVEISKRLGDTTVLYDTCVKLIPEFGYYFDIVPRSSLSKSGYCVSNSVGIIDRSYRGTVKIALTKMDNSLPDIELPCRCAQIILRKSNHYRLIEEMGDVDDNTNRGVGGFGSTG